MYFHEADRARLKRIECLLLKLLGEEEMSTNALDTQIATLTSQVQQNTSVIGSAETLLSGLAASLQAALQSAQQAGASPEQLAEIQALQTQLANDDTGLAASVVANTPAASSPPASPSTAQPAATAQRAQRSS